MKEDLKGLIGNQEKILYEGKPSKKCFVFESIFNPLLPFAILWAVIDFVTTINACMVIFRWSTIYFHKI